MIPITKNICVTDEFGNSLHPTYLRRAKGLVKKGRARWVDNETIREILKMLNRLLDIQSQAEEKPYLRNMLEKVLSDNSVAQSAIQAASNSELDSEDKAKMIQKIASQYELTKKEIALKILEKLVSENSSLQEYDKNEDEEDEDEDEDDDKEGEETEEG